MEDRAMTIHLKRRLPPETVSRLPRNLIQELEKLRRKAARWAEDNYEALLEADPVLPEKLHDRARDNWRFLFAIAELVGEDWKEKVSRAAMELEGFYDLEDHDSYGIRLLRDIKTQFARLGGDEIQSSILRQKLNEMKDAIWPE